MNKGTKTIGVIFSLLLLSILLFVVLISAVYPLPLMLERFRFFTITNYYMQQYIFWVAVGLAILLIIALLIVIFYPKTIGTFLLKKGDGELTLDKKAIEGMVRSHLHEDEFIHSPKVNIKATKNKIAVTVKGELKRTSSLIGKTKILMDEIEKEVKQLLGTDEQVKVSVKYTGYQAPTNKYQTNEHARVE
ncbi:alkaline shock response membrane anchor protein AmaP [Enterococcus hirae]|nr:alkaline shock response membrane anchor protein AmaP [Enterococcus hirae]EMF0192983.1 alkaline shock response membrane anchor protein AmaP [Enterococcus hirae]EMF0239304.1 alkaline shock response membrane anchor protein AmaP [Enterococcus hirae]EMF0246200.1 alkaline shock response membrane anchor protein AmaP [Enterococcus hirae]